MNKKAYNLSSIIQFITYTLVGTSNVIIDLIVLNVLWAISGHYLGEINYFFKLISFSIYSTTGYFLNRKFTFKTKACAKSYFSYISLLAVLSFLDAIILVKLTQIHIFHIPRELRANASALFAAMITGIFGFIINKTIIFKKQASTEAHKA